MVLLRIDFEANYVRGQIIWTAPDDGAAARRVPTAVRRRSADGVRPAGALVPLGRGALSRGRYPGTTAPPAAPFRRDRFIPARDRFKTPARAQPRNRAEPGRLGVSAMAGADDTAAPNPSGPAALSPRLL